MVMEDSRSNLESGKKQKAGPYKPGNSSTIIADAYHVSYFDGSHAWMRDLIVVVMGLMFEVDQMISGLAYGSYMGEASCGLGYLRKANRFIILF